MLHGTASSGTGTKLTRATIIVCGVASLVASLLSFVSVWQQTKNYRKPLLQRYVIRILLMVPIYAASSWGGIMSLSAAFYLVPLRDIYEAFTIYTFFQLLINFLGGERSLIIMMHGRPPVQHPWPLNHCFAKIDISDPHTFLAIKRGILQYAWMKPVLTILELVMKATGTYKEGVIELYSGYVWVGIVYNVSVTLSLYSLAIFWVCMSHDLQPFRPVPKFLCIKLIIFASYWQGFFLSILQVLGAIPNDVPGYTADNLAAAIQDALICCEMPMFAIAHWYAFSWRDYADKTISAARMPVIYAMRDSFGIRDLIEDTKETFSGKNYEYRKFDSDDNVLAHEESDSRVARMIEGMRYDRGGKRKYWIPRPGEINSQTPLLGNGSGPSTIGGSNSTDKGRRTNNRETLDEAGDPQIDPEDERLFTNARALEFGDWNYPVITAHVPSIDRWRHSDPEILTTSANRNLMQPTLANGHRRESAVLKKMDKGKRHSSSHSGGSTHPRKRAPVLDGLLREESSSSSKSGKSGRSQLVDLVVEDNEAEEMERVRARKEGGAAWNESEAKHFVRTYDDESQGEFMRTGFEPSEQAPAGGSEFAVGEDEDEDEDEDPGAQSEGCGKGSEEQKEPGEPDEAGKRRYGSLDDRNVWNTDGRDDA